MPEKFRAEVYRAAGQYDRDAASVSSGLACEDPSLAIQSQAAEADINTLIERFHLTGEIPIVQRVPLELDVDEVLDYRTAMDHLNMAKASFMSLPAKVRAAFENDPVAFADFAVDPKNLPQLRVWGLAPPAPETPPAPPPGPQ